MDIARHHHHHHHRGRRHAPTTPRPNRDWRDTGGYRDLGPPDSAAATASVVTTAATTRGRRTPDDSAMVASQGRQIGSPAVEASLWILHALFPQPFRSCVGIEHTPTESATTVEKVVVITVTYLNCEVICVSTNNERGVCGTRARAEPGGKVFKDPGLPGDQHTLTPVRKCRQYCRRDNRNNCVQDSMDRTNMMTELLGDAAQDGVWKNNQRG